MRKVSKANGPSRLKSPQPEAKAGLTLFQRQLHRNIPQRPSRNAWVQWQSARSQERPEGSWKRSESFPEVPARPWLLQALSQAIIPEHRDHHQRRHDDFQHKRPTTTIGEATRNSRTTGETTGTGTLRLILEAAPTGKGLKIGHRSRTDTRTGQEVATTIDQTGATAGMIGPGISSKSGAERIRETRSAEGQWWAHIRVRISSSLESSVSEDLPDRSKEMVSEEASRETNSSGTGAKLLLCSQWHCRRGFEPAFLQNCA